MMTDQFQTPAVNETSFDAADQVPMLWPDRKFGGHPGHIGNVGHQFGGFGHYGGGFGHHYGGGFGGLLPFLALSPLLYSQPYYPYPPYYSAPYYPYAPNYSYNPYYPTPYYPGSVVI